MKYLTSVQTAEKWGLTKRRVNSLCKDGCIRGAYKDGYRWMIPEDAVRPGGTDRKMRTVKVGNGKRPLAVGIENYKEIVEKSYYYVDKTLLIRELLDNGGKVYLFTRPRRFGKTLGLSMIKTFFEQEIGADGDPVDNSRYFDGMAIMNAGDAYTRHLGSYPVISLSLKSGKQPDFRMAYECLVEQIAIEYKRHAYILDAHDILLEDKEKYRAIMGRSAQDSDYVTALAFLAECLKKYHGRNVVVLLDEYDVPLENAYFRGFYDQMIDFIRSLFESVLKTNDNLEFAVVTGCLRVGRESIFTGLNNLEINSVLNDNFAEYFGFTQTEVETMLASYAVSEKREEIRHWYDGYLFGQTEVYNPWSVTNYVKTAVTNEVAYPRPYWSNTSSNSIIRELVDHADEQAKAEIERLISGEPIEKPVHEEITYEDICRSQDYLWNFLFFTGYLKMATQRMEGNVIYVTLAIPNEEVRYIYQNTIREWFEEKQKVSDFSKLYEAMRTGQSENVEDFLNGQLEGSISYYDSAEQFYHGYMLGVLSGMNGCEIRSNKELGDGRADLVVAPFSPKQPAIVIELKRTAKFTQMEQMCDQALQQIEDRRYAQGLLNEGYQRILKYGICFCKKHCMVKSAVEEPV